MRLKAVPVSRQTYYVVQSFTKDCHGTHMDPPIQVPSEAAARRLAEALSKRKASVLAFARTGDPATGEFDDAVVLVQYGQIAEDAFEDLPF